MSKPAQAAPSLRGEPKASRGNLPANTENFSALIRTDQNFGSCIIRTVMDFQTLGNLATALTVWGAAFLLALWASLVYWTWRDAQARLRDPMRRWLAVLVSVVLFIPGTLIYLLLRPQRTIEEEYLVTLEEEALLRAIEGSEGKSTR